MKIGMAVLAYERPEYLEKCLNSLFKTNLYDYDIQFLINDDGSKDPRVKELIDKERDSKYNITRNFTEHGKGFASSSINKATKTLLEMDDFDVIGWCDPDAIFHPEWLDQTFKICLWAKANHKQHILGPWSSWNANNSHYHKIVGTYTSPYGNYVIKRQMGMLNYFYLTEEFKEFGFFDERVNDEELMTKRFEKLGVNNFCTETSYIEHIGIESTLRTPVASQYVVAVNLIQGDWDHYVSDEEYRPMRKERTKKEHNGLTDNEIEENLSNLFKDVDWKSMDSAVECFNKYLTPKKVKVVLDIGSRDVNVSIGLSKHYPRANVYAFECNPIAIKLCKKNMKDSSKKITLIEKAVTDKTGKISFYKIDPEKTITTHKDGNIGASSIFEANKDYPIETYVQDKIVVDSITLKKWARESDINNIDLIWMDLQGAELKALKGLKSLIKSVKLIYTEVLYWPMYHGAPLFDEIDAYLRDNNFELVKKFYECQWFGDVLYVNRGLVND